MKNLDVLIVRYVPLVLFLWSGIDILLSACGRWMTCANMLFGWNVVFASSFFIVSLFNSRYHCVWNRCIYGYLIAAPIINYTDAKIGLFHTYDGYLSFFAFFYFISLLTTIIMAVIHYANAKKRNKERSSLGDKVTS